MLGYFSPRVTFRQETMAENKFIFETSPLRFTAMSTYTEVLEKYPEIAQNFELGKAIKARVNKNKNYKKS